MCVHVHVRIAKRTDGKVEEAPKLRLCALSPCGHLGKRFGLRRSGAQVLVLPPQVKWQHKAAGAPRPSSNQSIRPCSSALSSGITQRAAWRWAQTYSIQVRGNFSRSPLAIAGRRPAGRRAGAAWPAHSAAAAAVEGVRSHPQLIHADRQTAQHISRCLRPPNSAGSKQWRAAAAALRALTTTLRLAARRSGLPQRRPAASIPQSPWPGAALRWDSSTALRRERS